VLPLSTVNRALGRFIWCTIPAIVRIADDQTPIRSSKSSQNSGVYALLSYEPWGIADCSLAI
jgi:hypothetical protein